MSISLSDFNTYFVVQIRNIAVPHVDETGITPAAVGFNVVCTLNSRVQYFEYHFTDQNLVNSSTSQQLVDYAWSILSSQINTWAATAMTESNLIGYIYTPTSTFNINMNLATFNTDFTVAIARFEIFPATDPTSWCVGFSITNKVNNVNLYISTNVNVNTFNVSSTELEIMNSAWNQIKDTVGTWAADKISYSQLINTNYVPSTF